MKLKQLLLGILVSVLTLTSFTLPVSANDEEPTYNVDVYLYEEGCAFPLSDAVFTLTGTTADNIDIAPKEIIMDGVSTTLVLPAGTYTLELTQTPPNYTSADPITFTVGESGIYIDNNKVDYIERALTYTGTDRFPVQFAVLNKELPYQRVVGAICSLYKQNESGKYSLYALFETEEADELYQLPTGTYFLHQDSVPTGYILNEEDVIFRVNADGSITELKGHYNGAEVYYDHRKGQIIMGENYADNYEASVEMNNFIDEIADDTLWRYINNYGTGQYLATGYGSLGYFWWFIPTEQFPNERITTLSEEDLEEFTITFDTNLPEGATLKNDYNDPAPRKAKYGRRTKDYVNWRTAIDMPSALVEGYTYKGWTTTKNGSDFYDITSPVYQNITLYAKWEKEEQQEEEPVYYLVQFRSENKDLLGIRLLKGSDATSNAPTPPKRIGYTFVGWDKDITNIQSDLIVNAVWEEEIAPIPEYTVIFKDGNTTLKTMKVKQGENAVPPTNPTKTGYTFNGWDKSYENIQANTTIYATWIKDTEYVVITFMSDGNTIATSKVSLGSSAVAPSNPSKEGFVFVGWDKDFSNVQENLVVNAVWREMKNGFYTENGKTYYYRNDNKVYKQQKIGDYWYCFDKDSGEMLTGFVNLDSDYHSPTDRDKIAYYNEQGRMQYGQRYINGYWYMFDYYSGAMRTGFVDIPSQNKTVYYDTDGKMIKGQKYINGYWYFFDYVSGGMKKGFVYIEHQDKTVYYDEKGHMLYGQRNINGKWYNFAQGTGKMLTGFVNIPYQDKTVYYCQDGYMLYGQQRINGYWYNFQQGTGKMITGFLYIPYQNKTVYYNSQGRMLYGRQYIGGKWYTFDKYSGAMK